MKKLILILATASAFATSALAMTADELIAKHLEAIGGADKITAIQSAKMTGKVLVMGMELPFTVYQKRNNMMKVESSMQGASFVQCFNGDNGWSINPMTGSMDPQDMGEIEQKVFKIESDMDGMLIDYQKKGYSVEYIGEDEVEGTPVHHLKLNTGADVTFDMYFDTEYLMQIKNIRKITVDDNDVEEGHYFSDFKDVGGLILPHAIENRQGEQVTTQIMIETVEYGVEIDDAIFQKPAVEEKATPAEQGE